MLIEQSIYLEPISNVIFTSHNPIQLFGFDQRPSRLSSQAIRPSSCSRSQIKRLQYNLFTDIYSRTRRIKAFDPGHSIPGNQVDPRYLQLPDTGSPYQTTDRNRLLRDSTSQLGQVLLLEGFLRSQFEYSALITAPEILQDPLGNFLFSTRTGHCEYFATALVVPCSGHWEFRPA